MLHFAKQEIFFNFVLAFFFYTRILIMDNTTLKRKITASPLKKALCYTKKQTNIIIHFVFAHPKILKLF